MDLSIIKDQYISKIIENEDIFKKVEIGNYGQILWHNVAYMKDLDGNKIPCEYDISPEFAYIHSKPINSDSFTEIH
ncbi:hypothetical protein [Flavobacteriaceae bacterium 14752]|uniref:hypothetical protein n=1 Tax=Mesohalobacter salilacus TaxID=2491711 RepID=UPI000F644803|nr:hypothetical protein EIG84_06815 [Flavobacteriaceae bacterium 14752]